MFKIHMVGPDGETQDLSLDKNEVTIGRLSTAEIQLRASNVSKQHSRIVFREGRYFLIDRKSTNGTFLNGNRVITPQSLKNGDRIHVGDFAMTFLVEENEAAKPKKPMSPPPLPVNAPVASKPAALEPMALQDGDVELIEEVPEPKAAAPVVPAPVAPAPAAPVAPTSTPVVPAPAPVVPAPAPAVPAPAPATPAPAPATPAPAPATPAPAPAVPAAASDESALLYLDAERHQLYEEALTFDEFKDEENFHDYRLDEENVVASVKAKLEALIAKRLEPSVPEAVRLRLRDQLLYELLGYGLFEKYLYADEVEEVLVNGPDTIILVSNGVKKLVTDSFSCDAALFNVVARLVVPAGFPIDEESPFLDVTVPDGFTIRGVLHPLSANGTAIRLIKPPRERVSLNDLHAKGLLNEGMLAYLQRAVAQRKTLLVVSTNAREARTAVGALCDLIPATERVALINTGAALNFERDDRLRLETSVMESGDDLGALLQQLERMAVTRAVTLSLRETAALDWLYALNAGLDGSIFSLYGKDASDGLTRLLRMAQYAAPSFTESALRSLLSQTVHAVLALREPGEGPAGLFELSPVNESYELKKLFS